MVSQQVLLTLLSNNIQNLIFSHHLHFYYPSSLTWITAEASSIDPLLLSSPPCRHFLRTLSRGTLIKQTSDLIAPWLSGVPSYSLSKDFQSSYVRAPCHLSISHISIFSIIVLHPFTLPCSSWTHPVTLPLGVHHTSAWYALPLGLYLLHFLTIWCLFTESVRPSQTAF